MLCWQLHYMNSYRSYSNSKKSVNVEKEKEVARDFGLDNRSIQSMSYRKENWFIFFVKWNWKWIEPRRDESIHLFALLKKQTTGDAALNFCPKIACFHSSDEQHFGRWHPLRPWMAFRFDHGRSFLGQYWENISIHVHFLQPEQSESKFNIISKRKETYSCALPVPQKTFSVIKNMIFFVLKPMNTSTLSRRKLMKL